MAKKNTTTQDDDSRRSRKEILQARKLAQQNRRVWIGVSIVGGLLAIVFLLALINEFLLVPNRAIATVGDTDISLNEWQERVQFERAQRIILLDNQREAFGGDVGIIQQFAPQAITELAPQNAETFGQNVLDLMVDEILIRQAAEARGITVTDEEVQAELEASFNYFQGESPTPQPTPTATVEPTPSVTPLPTAVITDVLPTSTPFPTFTPGPTATPQPTATPVSEASYQEQLDALTDQLSGLDADPDIYREIIRTEIYRDRLIDALAAEQELPEAGEQVSLWLLAYNTEEEANEGLALVQSDGFLPTWNAVRSFPTPEGATVSATELLWRTQGALSNALGSDVAEAAFSLGVGETSEVLTSIQPDGSLRYYIIQPSGREVRPLSFDELQANRRDLLTTLLNDSVLTAELTEGWRGRTPTTPILDPAFFTPPTPAPTQPAVLPTTAPDAGTGE